jgi:hypothetical protein
LDNTEGWEPKIDELIIEEFIRELRKFSQSYSEIIAAAFSEKKNILFSTSSWDLNPQIKRFISNWKSYMFISHGSIHISGIKYSIFQLERDRIVALALSGYGQYFLAINSKFKYFLFLNILTPHLDLTDPIFNNLLKLWNKFFS